MCAELRQLGPWTWNYRIALPHGHCWFLSTSVPKTWNSGGFQETVDATTYPWKMWNFPPQVLISEKSLKNGSLFSLATDGLAKRRHRSSSTGQFLEETRSERQTSQRTPCQRKRHDTTLGTIRKIATTATTLYSMGTAVFSVTNAPVAVDSENGEIINRRCSKPLSMMALGVLA